MRASTFSFRTATLLAVCGMAMGIGMAASRDHSLMPAHAHLNLLGWVSLFLLGIYYRLHPAIDIRTLAKVQVWIWTAGTVVLTIGVSAIHLGYEAAEPLAKVGSLAVLGAMLVFVVLVFRSDAETVPAAARLTPAE